MYILLGLFFACSSTADPMKQESNSTSKIENASGKQSPPAATENTPASGTSIPLSNPVHSTISGTDKLPDLREGLSKSGCDNGPGGAGAASYFVGTLNISGSSVSGQEEWIMYANKKWKAVGGKDCVVRWTLNGNKSSPKACGSCTLGVALTNAIDLVDSTCPEDMAKNSTGKPINYDIRLHDDGRAEVYFARSGKKVGEGYHNNNTITYVTDMSCRWF